jgi:hypothetical protein
MRPLRSSMDGKSSSKTDEELPPVPAIDATGG